MTNRNTGSLWASVAVAVALAACSGENNPPDSGLWDSRAEAGQPDAAVDSRPRDRGEPDVGRRDSSDDVRLDAQPDVDASPPDADARAGDATSDTAAALPLHARCAAAKTLALSGGKVAVNDTIAAQSNEYGSTIKCGNALNPAWSGGQLYYKVRLTQGLAYTFDPQEVIGSGILRGLFVVSGCGATTINADCNGAAGYLQEQGAFTGLVFFVPPATADYIVVVEAMDDMFPVSFGLTIEEHTRPTNDRCAQPQQLTFSAGKVAISGTTSFGSNEFGTTINCGATGNFSAPQLYYSLPLKANKGYHFAVTFTKGATGTASWLPDARMLFFRDTCDPATINVDCAAAGTAAGVPYENKLTFSPAQDAVYKVAIDAHGPSVGDFALTAEEFSPAANSVCSAAQPLTMSDGQAVASGDLALALDEFGSQIDCNTGSAFAGPQLYYTVGLQAGKKYRLWPGRSAMRTFYVFGQTCAPATIDSDCGSGGVSGLVWTGPRAAGTVFAPTVGGTYTIAVEGDKNVGPLTGVFDVIVDEYVDPPTNTTCAAARTLSFANGVMYLISDTSNSTNEFGSQITCNQSTALDGPQLTYRVTMSAAHYYEISSTAALAWNAKLYVTGDTCDPATINSQCGSNGTNGLVLDLPGRVRFRPPTDGTYRITVDGASGGAGLSVAKVSESLLASNGTCQNAQSVTLTGATTTVSGDTALVADEFAGQVRCGLASALAGAQVYYSVYLVAGTPYTFTVEPTGWALPRLYIFGDTCVPATIDTQCASAGASGAISPPGAPAASVTFTPTQSGTYRFAVDSEQAPGVSTSGPFVVTITQ